MLYKMPACRSSKIFVTPVFWRLRNHTFDGHISKIFVSRVFLRLRNHTFDGHISALEQDRDNLKPLLSTKSPMRYRLVPLLSRSRDHITSGLTCLPFRSHTNRPCRYMGPVPAQFVYARCVSAYRAIHHAQFCHAQLNSAQYFEDIISKKKFRRYVYSFCRHPRT